MFFFTHNAHRTREEDCKEGRQRGSGTVYAVCVARDDDDDDDDATK